ncbi:Myb-like DNA-binding domain containing protein [Trichomonas vaginalis G3]|uniref:Myb-like DNA-binding domain containing protein n=1 Tax=Trichomonas vaginalis (strain ATCC PRA-98 / G3) TaxID=412133 RepID=A2FT12_TRIV3|nr:RNA polymerase II transcription regulator recruiting protein [Trichomonas vaginalis G3]EAX91949.1 Myb-like DNA-binding domain containing protein [Trichomonas vaginalis G3]KAI5514333.1 RNA polymerase II transcription regulator recruiting protein [Trichomonas vaginalis G3]|eukprot:XP_001304879.1 Myb-like DNA-binding domain containing protein [Trichomonas vaginalis G3]
MSDNTSENLYNELMVGVAHNQIQEIRVLFYKYILNSITIDEARKSCKEITGSTDCIEKLHKFIELQDTPLIYNNKFEFSSIRKNNSWSSIEDQRLISAIHKYGTSNWGLIRDFIGTKRSSAQCSQRWLRSLNPLINKSHWTPEEDYRLLNAVQKFGEKSWTKIAAELSGRTDCQCRYRYQQIAKKFPADLGVNANDYISKYCTECIMKNSEINKEENPPAKIIKDDNDVSIFEMMTELFE